MIDRSHADNESRIRIYRIEDAPARQPRPVLATPFACPRCEKRYATEAGLYKHRRTYHPETILPIGRWERGTR